MLQCMLLTLQHLRPLQLGSLFPFRLEGGDRESGEEGGRDTGGECVCACVRREEEDE